MANNDGGSRPKRQHIKHEEWIRLRDKLLDVIDFSKVTARKQLASSYYRVRVDGIQWTDALVAAAVGVGVPPTDALRRTLVREHQATLPPPPPPPPSARESIDERVAELERAVLSLYNQLGAEMPDGVDIVVGGKWE